MWWHLIIWLESSWLLRLFLVMWWYWEMSNAQSCNWKSIKEVATLWFGRQPFQCGSWNTQTSVCWICFILYLVRCLDIISSTQLCHILHGFRLRYCCNLLIDYKTSYSFKHAGSSVTVITIDAILEEWILFSEIDKYSYWFRCQDQSRFHHGYMGLGFDMSNFNEDGSGDVYTFGISMPIHMV